MSELIKVGDHVRLRSDGRIEPCEKGDPHCIGEAIAYQSSEHTVMVAEWAALMLARYADERGHPVLVGRPFLKYRQGARDECERD